MQFLYNIFIYLFKFVFKVFALFNLKAKKGVEGRKNWEEKIKKEVDLNDLWVWMHCSSLGEFEQGRPVFEALKKKYPNYKFALSFFSPSGYEIRKNYKEADLVFYLPFDTPQNAKKLAQIFQPKLWILAKYDYWYNHLKYQSQNGTKVVVISAIFRENQIYFKPYGKWFLKKLKQYIQQFFVQNQSSEQLLKNHGINHVILAGDTRFDRVKTIAQNTQKLEWVENFKNQRNLIVVGSSWKDDENLWTNFINKKLPDDWKIIIVPHEIKQEKIQSLKKSIQKKTIIYSEFIENNKKREMQEHQVLIVDAIGLLSTIYASADLAYVGGGFNKSGVHNTLEPSVFGVPVIIGPNYQKFDEAKKLKQEGIIFPVSSQKELNQVACELIQYPENKILIKNKCAKFFKKQPASSQIILNYIHYVLKS